MGALRKLHQPLQLQAAPTPAKGKGAASVQGGVHNLHL